MTEKLEEHLSNGQYLQAHQYLKNSPSNERSKVEALHSKFLEQSAQAARQGDLETLESYILKLRVLGTHLDKPRERYSQLRRLAYGHACVRNLAKAVSLTTRLFTTPIIHHNVIERNLSYLLARVETYSNIAGQEFNDLAMHVQLYYSNTKHSLN